MRFFFAAVASLALTACGDFRSRNGAASRDEESQQEPWRSSDVYGLHADGWITVPISLRVDKDFTRRQRRAISAAVDRWNTAAGNIILEVSARPFNPSYEGMYDLLDDDVNSIVLEPDWSKTPKSKAVIGTAIWETELSGGDRITDGDILLNSASYVFGAADERVRNGRRDIVDLETIMLHELGHLLGLSHVSCERDPDSIMRPSVPIGQRKTHRYVSDRDKALVRYLFSSDSPAPRDPPPETKSQQCYGTPKDGTALSFRPRGNSFSGPATPAGAASSTAARNAE